MKKTSILLVTTLVLGFISSGVAADFDFTDPKGVNNVAFSLDAPLESISGTASGISGVVSYNPADPGGTTGKIIIQAASMQVGNTKMQEHMHSKGWMNVEKYPELVFEVESLSNLQISESGTDALAVGKLTIKGKTVKIQVPVKLTYLEGALGKRFPKKKGDLLVLRSEFAIGRSQFGVKAGEKEDKVSDKIVIRLSIAGGAEK